MPLSINILVKATCVIADWNKVIDIEHESIRPSKSRSLTFRKITNLPILKTQFVIHNDIDLKD